jgi:hypothetical protein
LLTSALFLLTLVTASDLDPAPKYKAWVEDHEIWTQTDAGDHQVLYDALASEPAAVSPSGDRVVYAVLNPLFDAPHCGNTPQKYLALVKTNGNPIWKIGFEEACNDFERFEWIDDKRIGAMLCGHANCFYWVVDALSGKILQKFGTGFDFLWSHNRKWVAHRQLGLGFEEGDALLFNSDDIVYPHPWPTTGFRTIGHLTWSPDDKWVSFGEMDFPSYDSYVVLVSPQGEVVREDLPVDVEYDSGITWTDNTHVEITTSRRTFRFELQGNKLHETSNSTDKAPLSALHP